MFLGMNSFNMIPWSAPTNKNHWLTEDIVAVFKFESATKIKQNQIRQDSPEMFGNSVDGSEILHHLGRFLKPCKW